VPPYRNSYRDYTEWNLAKTPFEDRHDSQADDKYKRVPNIEELFDAAVRHRFGLLISRATRS
jgi:hypothetical protein